MYFILCVFTHFHIIRKEILETCLFEVFQGLCFFCSLCSFLFFKKFFRFPSHFGQLFVVLLATLDFGVTAGTNYGGKFFGPESFEVNFLNIVFSKIQCYLLYTCTMEIDKIFL